MKNEKVRGKVKSILADLTVIKSATGERRISGWASKPSIDRMREVVDVMAFESTLSTFRQNPIMLWMHQSSVPIGTWDQMELRADGLWVSGVIAAEGVKAADEAWSLIEQGIVKALSIGFREIDGKMDDADNVFHITQLELYEISVVSIPANRDALFTMGDGKLLDIELLAEPVEELAIVEEEQPESPPATLAVEQVIVPPVTGVKELIKGWTTGVCAGCNATNVDVVPFAEVRGVEWRLCLQCFVPPGVLEKAKAAVVPESPMTAEGANKLAALEQRLDELSVLVADNSGRTVSVEKSILGLIRLNARHVAARLGRVG